MSLPSGRFFRLLFVICFLTDWSGAPEAACQPGPAINRFSDDDSVLARVMAPYDHAFIYKEVYTEAKNTPSPFHYSRVVYRYHILLYRANKARLMLVTSEYLERKHKTRIRKSGHRADKALAKSYFEALDSSGFMYLSMAELNDKLGPVTPDGTAKYFSLSDVGSTDALAKTPQGVAFYLCDYPEHLVAEIPEKSGQRVIFLNVLNRFLVEFLGRPGHYYKIQDGG